MQKIWRAILLACTFSAAIVSSQATAENTAVERAMRRGTTMFWYDRVAWVSTDDMLANLPSDRHTEIGGWIVTPLADGWHIYYHGKGADADTIIYEADVSGNSVTNRNIYPRSSSHSLPASAATLAKALSVARQEMAKHTDWSPCVARPFNTIVLPPDADGTISVYFLTPQTIMNSFPFGGHYQVVISAMGKVVSARRFTNICIALTKERSSTGAAPEGMYLTHLLDPYPNEIHVFEQYPVGVPLYVGIAADKSVWKVQNGQISSVKTP